MSVASTRDSVDLETFILELPSGERDEVRAAAERIDDLEREVGQPGWLEENFFKLTIAALILFALGIAGLIGALAGLRGAIGLGGVVLLLAAFPTLVFAYLWSVRGRTRIDDAKMRLNERHFLPHGGVYFGGRSGKREVMRVEPPGEDKPDLRERTRRLYAAATTTRRWRW